MRGVWLLSGPVLYSWLAVDSALSFAIDEPLSSNIPFALALAEPAASALFVMPSPLACEPDPPDEFAPPLDESEPDVADESDDPSGFGVDNGSVLSAFTPGVGETLEVTSGFGVSVGVGVPVGAGVDLRSPCTLCAGGCPCTGVLVAAVVGAGVGSALGFGVPVGAFVGVPVGAPVGAFVGAFVGLSPPPGVDVGAFVGAPVGAFVGPSVGPAVGDVVGAFVGPSVGPAVGDVVGAFVGLSPPPGVDVGAFVGA